MEKAPEISFIGREREMEALTVGLERALVGLGRLVLLAGDSGIGKTHLSQELAKVAVQQGATILWGRCYDQRGAPPYWPWIQAIRLYAQRLEADVLLAHMGPGVADIAEIVPEPAPSQNWVLPHSNPNRPDFASSTPTTFLQAPPPTHVVILVTALNGGRRYSCWVRRQRGRVLPLSSALPRYRSLQAPPSETLVNARQPSNTVLSVYLPAHNSWNTWGDGRIQRGEACTNARRQSFSDPNRPAYGTRRREWSTTSHKCEDAIGQQLGRRHRRATASPRLSPRGGEFEFGALARFTDSPDEDLLNLLDEALEARVRGGSGGSNAISGTPLSSRPQCGSPSRKVRLHAARSGAGRPVWGGRRRACHGAGLPLSRG
jgi:hypothetical protein